MWSIEILGQKYEFDQSPDPLCVWNTERLYIADHEIPIGRVPKIHFEMIKAVSAPLRQSAA